MEIQTLSFDSFTLRKLQTFKLFEQDDDKVELKMCKIELVITITR